MLSMVVSCGGEGKSPPCLCILLALSLEGLLIPILKLSSTPRSRLLCETSVLVVYSDPVGEPLFTLSLEVPYLFPPPALPSYVSIISSTT